MYCTVYYNYYLLQFDHSGVIIIYCQEKYDRSRYSKKGGLLPPFYNYDGWILQFNN